MAEKLRSCLEGGYLVGSAHAMGADIDAYWRNAPLFGCCRLRCARCGEQVRDTVRVDNPARAYACSCFSTEIIYPAPAPDPDPYAIEDRSTPWRCAGHPPLTLPVTLDGLAIPAVPDWRVVVPAALDHSDHLHPTLADVGGFAAVRLLMAAEPPLRRDIVEAIVDTALSSDPKRSARAMRALVMAPLEPGVERFVAAALLRPTSFTAPDPDVPAFLLSNWVANIAAARIEPDSAGIVQDQRSLELLRALAVQPPGIGGRVYNLAWADPDWVLSHTTALLDAGPPATWEMLLIAFKGSDHHAYELVRKLVARGIPEAEIRERSRTGVAGFPGSDGVERALAAP